MQAPYGRVESYAIAKFGGAVMLCLCVLVTLIVAAAHHHAGEPMGIDLSFAGMSGLGVFGIIRWLP